MGTIPKDSKSNFFTNVAKRLPLYVRQRRIVIPMLSPAASCRCVVTLPRWAWRLFVAVSVRLRDDGVNLTLVTLRVLQSQSECDRSGESVEK